MIVTTRVPSGEFEVMWVKNGPIDFDGQIPVSSQYGPRAPLSTPAGTTSNFHTGVDLRAARGSRVIPRFGRMRIVIAGWDDGAGWWVRGKYVDGPLRDWDADFYHLDKRPSVVLHSVVGPESTLGVVGTTGKSTGVHLHWQLRMPNGQLVNPISRMVESRINGGIVADTEYTVKAGDTLSAIAARFSVADWRDIARWSGFPPDFIPETLEIGTVLRLVAPEDTTPETPPETPPVETPPVETPPSDAEETAAAALARGAAVIRELARDFQEKGGLLMATAEAIEAAAVALVEARS